MFKMSIPSFPTSRLIEWRLKRGNVFRISFLGQFVASEKGLIGIQVSKIGIHCFDPKLAHYAQNEHSEFYNEASNRTEAEKRERF